MRVLCLFLTLVVSACAPIGEMIQNAGQPSVKTVSTTQPTIDQVQLEAYNGPRARVAVSRFADQSGKGKGMAVGYPGFGWYTPQIGNGMADMLSDALLQSNRFIVLDRQSLDDVLREQDLAGTGRISRETGARMGEIEGAKLLIKGSVTEFEPGSAGANAGALLGGFGWTGALIGGLAGGLQQSHVAMIIQVVDARTSRMLFSTTVEGKANDFNIGGALAGVGGGFLGGAGLGTYQKTPVEKAIRIAIQQAVKDLASKTPSNYFRHGISSGGVSSAPAPNPPRPTVAVPSGNEKAREVIKVNSPLGKGASVLPATVIVKVASANLRESAGTQGKVVATLSARTKLSVQGEDNGWYFVQTDDQKAGWLAKSLTAN